MESALQHSVEEVFAYVAETEMKEAGDKEGCQGDAREHHVKSINNLLPF